jgi:hypothetical protein
MAVIPGRGHGDGASRRPSVLSALVFAVAAFLAARAPAVDVTIADDREAAIDAGGLVVDTPADLSQVPLPTACDAPGVTPLAPAPLQPCSLATTALRDRPGVAGGDPLTVAPKTSPPVSSRC